MLRFSNILLLIASLAFSVTAKSTDGSPKGFEKLCSFGETCVVSTPSMVAFGAGDLFVFKIINGTFVCGLQAFGQNPLPQNPNKICAIPTANDETDTAKKTTKAYGLADGRYQIVSKLSNKALSVTSEGITQLDYTGSKLQQWDIKQLDDGYFSVVSVESQNALELLHWDINDGAQLNLFDWHNSWNQHWQIQKAGDDSYSITSRFSHKSIDIFELNTHDGAAIRLWTYWGGLNQQWVFKLIPNKPGLKDYKGTN